MSAESSVGHICRLSGAFCTRRGGTARLRDSMPASTGQMPWFPIYPSPAELIEKRNLQDTKAHFLQKKICIYTRQ